MAYEIMVNGKHYTVDVEPETPLLWVLRDSLGLTGTKYGCGIGECGACSVLLGGQPVHSCTTRIQAVKDRAVTTIEGLSADGNHPVQEAWVAESVAQCGYCQPGMMLRAAALLKAKPVPSDSDINAAMTNLCRCGTYDRVRRAIKRAAAH